MPTKPTERALGCFHPSDVGKAWSGSSPDGTIPMGCSMMLWFCLMGVPPRPKFEPSTLITFRIGHDIHNMVQGWIERMMETGVGLPEDAVAVNEINTPRELDDEGDPLRDVDGNPISTHPLLILGSADTLITTHDLRQGVEIKSINDKNFRALTTAKKEHVVQGHCYMDTLDIPIMSYLYVNKNNSKMQEYHLAWDQRVWNQIEQKLTGILDKAAQGKSPDRETNRYCSDCRYFDACDPPHVRTDGSPIKLRRKM